MSNNHIGYPKECLLKENNDYICFICKGVFYFPVQTNCGHRFCKQCILDSLENSVDDLQCELCFDEIDSTVIIKKEEIHDDRAFSKELSKINVKCYFSGCNWYGIYAELEKHLLNCDFVKDICILCDKEIIRVSAHKCSFNEKCFFSCTHNYANKDNELLSKSICQHSLYLKKFIDKLNEIIGQSKNKQNNNTILIQLEKLTKLINSKEGLSSAYSLNTVEDTKTISNSNNTFQNSNNIVETNNSNSEENLLKNIEILFNHENFKTYFNSIIHPQILIDMNYILELKSQDTALKAAQLEQFKENLMECEKKIQSNEVLILDLQRKLLISDSTIKDLEIRLNFVEQTSFDGTLIWQITDFSKKREDALAGRITSIYSSPFYSSKYGYKMSVRIYLNGDGMGKGTHISLFFVIMKGNFDALLSWPFRNQVTMYFLDQVNKNHVVDAFKPDPTSSSFRQPITEMNIASGCPMFIPLIKLNEHGQTYIRNDTAYIKVVVNMNE